MFLLIQLVRSLIVSRCARKAEDHLKAIEAKAAVAEKAATTAVKAADPKNVSSVIAAGRAQAEYDEVTKVWLAAVDRCEQWEDRKKECKSPRSRFVTYLAGKIDAVTAVALLHPYVPGWIEAAKIWIG